MRFDGQVAIVTGGSGALGRHVTKAFVDEGARVAISYIIDEEVPELEDLLGNQVSAMRAYKVDVTAEESVQTFIGQVLRDFGHLDILVNAVGGYFGGPSVAETTLKEWNFMMDLNLKSAFLCSRAVIPHLLKAGRGKIVNVASRTGLEGKKGQAPYSISKAGVIRLTETLADELRGQGVNVNCILPSVIDTPTNREAMPKARFDKWPKPWEVARVILFLASDDAILLHGASLPVYGLF